MALEVLLEVYPHLMKRGAVMTIPEPVRPYPPYSNEGGFAAQAAKLLHENPGKELEKRLKHLFDTARGPEEAWRVLFYSAVSQVSWVQFVPDLSLMLERLNRDEREILCGQMRSANPMPKFHATVSEILVKKEIITRSELDHLLAFPDPRDRKQVAA